jgi:hypothetical protein
MVKKQSIGIIELRMRGQKNEYRLLQAVAMNQTMIAWGGFFASGAICT